MNIEKSILLAAAINEHLNAHIADMWPGFTPVPFILYDESHQTAVGDGWPKHYRQIQENIWIAEGNDPLLMGCTAIMYHNRLTAIWDTRTWPEDPDIADAAAGLAHEMFHVYQLSSLKMPYPNELLLPSYPHSPHSLSLVLEENRLLMDILGTQNPVLLREYLEKIIGLRKLREIEIGTEYMEYDKSVEHIEGTAVYVQLRMKSAIENMKPSAGAEAFFSIISKNDGILDNYRSRCYEAGAVFCLSADILCPDWQHEWLSAKMPLLNWMQDKLGLSEIAADPQNLNIQSAGTIISAYRAGKEQKLSTFFTQPLKSFDGDIELLVFDPMNLVCLDNRCLHKRGKIRIGSKEYLLEEPFVEIFDDTIIDAKQFFITETTVRNFEMR